MLHPLREAQLSLQTRRTFLSSVGQFSLGAIALHALQADALAPRPSRIDPARARASRTSSTEGQARSSTSHMSGGPPHLDLFDHKPALVKRDGQPCPGYFVEGRELRLHVRRAAA
jgi:hypothetical protein